MLNHAFRLSSLLLAFALTAGVARAEDTKPSTPFNGKDLTGWKSRASKKKASGRSASPSSTPTTPASRGSTTKAQRPGQQERRGRATSTPRRSSATPIELEFMVPKGRTPAST